MKKILSSVMYSLLLILPLNATVLASDIALSGSVSFECNFVSTYMEKHGYHLVEKDLHLNNLKIDRYAAHGAEVIIKNQTGAVIGTGKTDDKGMFSISVPEDHSYRIIIRFHDREIEDAVSYSGVKNITADLGYFDTEQVGRWIPIPPLQYCYTCDIRYLETRKRL